MNSSVKGFTAKAVEFEKKKNSITMEFSTFKIDILKFNISKFCLISTPLDYSFITPNMVHTQFLINSNSNWPIWRIHYKSTISSIHSKMSRLERYNTQNLKQIKHHLVIFRNNQSYDNSPTIFKFSGESINYLSFSQFNNQFSHKIRHVKPIKTLLFSFEITKHQLHKVTNLNHKLELPSLLIKLSVTSQVLTLTLPKRLPKVQKKKKITLPWKNSIRAYLKIEVFFTS